jgi:hypothetical protein
MKPEHWIITTGMIFAVLVFVAAVLPEDYQDAGTAVSSEAVAQTAAKAAPTRGLVPFSRAKTNRFQGKVVRVVSLGSSTGWGQLHIWVDEGNGGPAREISVAPDWYLMHLGCTIKENTRVDGTAFSFGKARPDPELYAKKISIGGKACDLRNDEGFALWSNRLR